MAKAKQTVKEQEPTIDQIESILAEKDSKSMHHGSKSGSEIERPDIISTGSFFVDWVLGGGFRASSWARLVAPPESGKTSMGLKWAKQWQDFYSERAMVVIFNAEGRVTAELIGRSGIDTAKDKFRRIDTNKSDFIYTMIERLVTDNPEKKVYFFMVDSTDACERTVDILKSIGEAEKIGGSATILSAAGKRLSLIFSVTGHHLYMSSQIRDNVNTHGPGGGGKHASGGNAPQFYSSLTGHITKNWTDLKIFENPSDTKSKEIGRLVEIRLEKTYNETTGQKVAFPVKYGHIGGVWREYEAMMMAQTFKMVDKSGAHFELNEKFREELKSAGVQVEAGKFHGERQLRDFFEASPDLVEYIHKTVRAAHSI